MSSTINMTYIFFIYCCCLLIVCCRREFKEQSYLKDWLLLFYVEKKINTVDSYMISQVLYQHKLFCIVKHPNVIVKSVCVCVRVCVCLCKRQRMCPFPWPKTPTSSLYFIFQLGLTYCYLLVHFYREASWQCSLVLWSLS